jgi:hypothetical protein
MVPVQGIMRTLHVLLFSGVIAIAGWWGLGQFVTRFWPQEPGALLSFFLLLFLTLTATLAPLAAYLNRRFAPEAAARAPWRFLRHSIWGALCLTSYAWLQMHRAFNLGFAFIIALIFAAIEVFIIRIGGDDQGDRGVEEQR